MGRRRARAGRWGMGRGLPMLKSILAVADGGPQREATLRTALLAADRLDAHLTVLHVRPDLEQLTYYGAEMAAPVGAFGPSSDELRRMVADRASRARAAYERVVAPAGARAVWRELEGPEATILASAGHVADLVVISRPGDGADDLHPESVNTALFETGRPVLVAPPDPRPTIGTRIAIAWNDSAQAARALGAAMPLIVTASAVTVFTAGAAGRRPATDGLLEYLDHYGIKPDLEAFDPGSSSARARGRALLRHAAAASADLLVMGAYGQGRVMQFLGLGGATAKVITATAIPLLLAH